jgi:hypothetical protein
LGTDLLAGGAERPEFLRQCGQLAKTWAHAGAKTNWLLIRASIISM